MDREPHALKSPPGARSTSRRFAEPTHGPGGRTPIHTELLQEWHARGRALPAEPDVQWASFADVPARR
ncbi:hypothetical protein [Streptomyces brasiliensis]|nr:hypothetical protein [Streptomyces brasiliensis]